MELGDLARYRWQIGGGLLLAILLVWYLTGYRPRAEERATLAGRASSLAVERDEIARRIVEEQQKMGGQQKLPTRVVPALAGEMTPTERLSYFLESITAPANDLDLSYFSVTPEPPRSGEGYEEIPFSISVSGHYAALADYLYQLEYARDFVVRDPVIASSDGQVTAEFRLAAVLLREAVLPDTNTGPADPGPPTSLELARDPFVRPPARLATGPDGRPYFLNVPPGLHLSGVMRTGGRMVAIINHEPYRVGHEIDNKKITRIDEHGVEMTDDVRTYFLEMEKPPPRGASAKGPRR